MECNEEKEESTEGGKATMQSQKPLLSVYGAVATETTGGS